jgi:hypothetical protein
MDGGMDKTKIFSSQSDMVGWTKQRFSHHKMTWWAGHNKDFSHHKVTWMVGWTKQRFSHHKVTWWARQNKDFLITK